MRPPLKITLDTDIMKLCYFHARKACLGGVSRVRGSDRSEKLLLDQFVGQLGTAALSLWVTGSIDLYILTRERANLNPRTGDGGSDLLGLSVDIKTSLMKKEYGLWGEYTLAVRPPERHAHVVYVLALVPDPRTLGSSFMERGFADVLLVGWADDLMLPKSVDKEGVFSGAYTLSAKDIFPMIPLRWTNNAALE